MADPQQAVPQAATTTTEKGLLDSIVEEGRLAKDDAARLADLLNAARSVAAAARQHDGDRARADVLRQRSEEQIDWQRQANPRILVAQQQPTMPDDHFLHRRQEVDRVRPHFHAVFGPPDRHPRPSRQQFVHQAAEIG